MSFNRRRDVFVVQSNVIKPDNRIHRRSNLVAHSRKESGLRNVRLLSDTQSLAKSIVLLNLLALNFSRITLQQDEKICAGINGVEVETLVKNFAADFASNVDNVRFGALELFANRRELERVNKIFLNVVIAFKHGQNLVAKIFLVNAFASYREDRAFAD